MRQNTGLGRYRFLIERSDICWLEKTTEYCAYNQFALGYIYWAIDEVWDLVNGIRR